VIPERHGAPAASIEDEPARRKRDRKVERDCLFAHMARVPGQVDHAAADDHMENPEEYVHVLVDLRQVRFGLRFL